MLGPDENRQSRANLHERPEDRGRFSFVIVCRSDEMKSVRIISLNRRQMVRLVQSKKRQKDSRETAPSTVPGSDRASVWSQAQSIDVAKQRE